MTISLCIIIKNEQEVLDNCLSSFKDVVDEIIIVDTGSSDNSKEIARKYSDKIYDFKWVNDFSKARNYSLSKASCDYIMWVDSDDYLLDSEKEKLLKLKENNDNNVDMYFLLYDFDKNYEPFYRERIFKNKKYQFKGKIHEAVIPSGNIKYVNITINQFDKKKGLSDRNLKIFEEMDINEFKCRDFYYYGKELYRHNKINKAKEMFLKCLNCNEGYYVDKVDACYYLSFIYRNENDLDNALKILFLSLLFDVFNIHIATEIANIYFIKKDYEKAIYYYLIALNTKYNNKYFINKDYVYFISCIQLCVCYFNIKKYDLAYYYNELAYVYKKDNKYYLDNKNTLINLI